MPEQAARYEADTWEENIADYLKTAHRVTVDQIAREALHIDTPRIGTAEQRRIAAALERLNWKRGRNSARRWGAAPCLLVTLTGGTQSGPSVRDPG
jgi:predicted P-loop ATPase